MASDLTGREKLMADELGPGVLSLEGGSFETPGAPLPPGPGTLLDVAPPGLPEAEPEGVVEVQGRRMVPVDAMVADRKRTRETTDRAVRAELEPLKAKAAEADQLRNALLEAQPYLNHLRQHPELLQPAAPTPVEESISDEDARTEARDLELYAADGQPDIVRAKRIIARRRSDSMEAATQAAAAAVGPITSQSAQQNSRHNFVQMATQGRDQVDPGQLAELWAQLPTELTQHPQVGELVLNAAIGRAVRAGSRPSPRGPTPQVSEPSGGRQGPGFRMNTFTQKIARAAGMSDQAFSKGAEGYRPNEINIIGD